MDVIKTSLIIAIAITFYYLLMQWPQGAQGLSNQASGQYQDRQNITIDESEYLQTKPSSSGNNTPTLSAMSVSEEAIVDEITGEVFRC